MQASLVLAYASGLLALVLVTMVYSRQTGCFGKRTLSPVGFFLGTYSIYLIGGSLVYWSSTDFSAATRLMFWGAIVVAPIAVLSGAIAVLLVTKFRKSEARRFVEESLAVVPSSHSATIVLVFTALVAGALWVFYAQWVDEIPILYALSGDSDPGTLTEVRAAGYKGMPDYVNHPMNLFRFAVVPFVLLYCYFVLNGTRSMRARLIFAAGLCVGIAYNSYTSALYPVAMLFAMLVVAIWVFEPLRLSRLSVVAALVLAFPVLMQVYVYSPESVGFVDGLAHALSRHAERFFIRVPELILLYVEYFTIQSDYLLGAAHRPIAIVTGQDFVNASNLIYLYRDPSDHATGYASVPFLGYAFADFGLLGVIAIGMIVGIVLQSCQVICVRGRRGAMYSARYALLIWLGYAYPTAAFTTGLVSKGLVPIMVLPLLLSMLSLGYSRGRSGPGVI